MLYYLRSFLSQRWIIVRKTVQGQFMLGPTFVLRRNAVAAARERNDFAYMVGGTEARRDMTARPWHVMKRKNVRNKRKI